MSSQNPYVSTSLFLDLQMAMSTLIKRHLLRALVSKIPCSPFPECPWYLSYISANISTIRGRLFEEMIEGFDIPLNIGSSLSSLGFFLS